MLCFSSLALNEYSQPEPDVAILRWRDELRTELPIPSDVLLVVEVADTSLSRDRDVKTTLYGRAGISEYWIVNLQQNVIEQSQQPSSDGYNTLRIWQRDETLTSSAFVTLRVPVDEVVVPAF